MSENTSLRNWLKEETPKMLVINKTDLDIHLEDLINRDSWEIEYSKDFWVKVSVVNLKDWKVIIRYKRGKYPFYGYCNPKKKTILIAINPKNTYPLVAEFKIGTEQTRPNFYRYVMKSIIFYNANELARFIFLHEFSHLLDHVRGLNLYYKQCKANRFAFRHFY